MKWSQYFLPTLKETPAEAVIPSHILMIRSGMIRKTNSGLYSYLPFGLKILKKLESIIREEMNLADALEITMPLLVTKNSLERSQRWNLFQSELYRLKDRHDFEMALSPTNEENFTELIQNEISSYRQLPINLYQINYKFRDEIRARYGVMRAKEFIMKDAYSFHLSKTCLEKTYQKMKEAYIRILTRVQLDFSPVKADSGAMGGSGSEEFMVKSQIGEEAIMVCQCGYTANLETADQKIDPPKIDPTPEPQMKEVFTPDQNTIEKVCHFLKVDQKQSIKTRLYEIEPIEKKKQAGDISSREPLVVLIRGDYEVNEVKLSQLFPERNLRLAPPEMIDQVFNCPPGYLGFKDLPEETLLVVDQSLEGLKNGIMGANRKDYHLTGIDPQRDIFKNREAQYQNIYLAREGGGCPKCGQPLNSFRGIEVGHIFKLGEKYCRDFGVQITDASGEKIIPSMGCYGIGVNRLLAAIIEQSHDERGMILPYEIAPFKILLISLNPEKKSVYQSSQKIYQLLKQHHLDPLWDDRQERAGHKFNDADLIGIPLQVVIGEKGIEKKQLELRVRTKGSSIKKIIDQEDLITEILQVTDRLASLKQSD